MLLSFVSIIPIIFVQFNLKLTFCQTKNIHILYIFVILKICVASVNWTKRLNANATLKKLENLINRTKMK